MASVLFGLAALATTAYAHGHIVGVVADDVYTAGWSLEYWYLANQGQTVPETPGWYAEDLDNGFIAPDAYGTSDIICHKNAVHANTTATVKAGGSLSFLWNTWPDSHVGPTISYFANCGEDCSTINKEDLKWVKYHAEGYTDGAWAAVSLISNNFTVDTTVPSTLAAGKYVFRHEIIALHGANSANGAQNYPQCLNIEVTGSGTENPEGTIGTELYTATDPGILFNPYVAEIDYTIPGPELYGSGSSGSGSGSGSTASATPTATSAAATSAAASVSLAAASLVASASATPVASETEPSATASAAPSTGTGSAEETFTVSSFIAWLEEQAGNSTSKVRRHARQF